MKTMRNARGAFLVALVATFEMCAPHSTASAAAAAAVAQSMPNSATTSAPSGPDARSNGAATHPVHRAAILYPGNPDAARTGKLLTTRRILSMLRWDHPGPSGIAVKSIDLMSWKQAATTVPGMHGKFHDFEIAPDRFVYRAVATFSRPLSVKGNTWRSGTQTLYVDAATGRVLTSSTGGTLIESAHSGLH